MNTPFALLNIVFLFKKMCQIYMQTILTQIRNICMRFALQIFQFRLLKLQKFQAEIIVFDIVVRVI